MSSGQDFTISVEKRLTGAERARASNYEASEAIRYCRGSKSAASGPNDNSKVEGGSRAQPLRVRSKNGGLIEYSRSRLKGVKVSANNGAGLPQADRIPFRFPHREVKVANGELRRSRQ
jgi:hypothetical protein